MLRERVECACWIKQCHPNLRNWSTGASSDTGTSVSNLKMREHQFLASIKNKEMKSVISRHHMVRPWRPAVQVHCDCHLPKDGEEVMVSSTTKSVNTGSEKINVCIDPFLSIRFPWYCHNGGQVLSLKICLVSSQVIWTHCTLTLGIVLKCVPATTLPD